ncbi:hypothetical protein CRG98_014756 [Punica granatum]|uniref:Uncharacterized protein n=1 Tax=Punica granatum TaxID=22663 RepID=A0A2I0K8H8_PUNGR|nr:hypothetical protein CRG98_014756 [Punica granatum]
MERGGKGREGRESCIEFAKALIQLSLPNLSFPSISLHPFGGYRRIYVWEVGPVCLLVVWVQHCNLHGSAKTLTASDIENATDNFDAKSPMERYGAILLELLTDRTPVNMSQPLGQENLVGISKIAANASLSVQPEVSHQPFMGEVVQALKLVCSERDEARDCAGSRNSSQEVLSIDLEEVEGTSPALHGQCLDPNYGHDTEMGLSISDLFSTS